MPQSPEVISMGYETDFTGEFRANKPFDSKALAFLQGLDARPGTPQSACPWYAVADVVMARDGKAYDAEAWLRLLLDAISPLGYVLNGQVEWIGEDPDDRGFVYH